MAFFESKLRTDIGPKPHIESDYEYLNRSARPEVERVRAFLERWIAAYPQEHRSELEARLRDRDDRRFNSAAFELLLFACMKSLGLSVEVHPQLPNGSTKRPDFLVNGDGDGFYLEAVLASEFDAEEIAAQRRKDVVLEALEGLQSPNFFLGFTADGNPNTPPSTKTLRKELKAWLDSLDPDEVMGTSESQLPTFQWRHGGWRVSFDAIPKKVEARGKGQRLIGMHMGGARWVNSWQPIRDAIKHKGGRYGDLDRPLLIAVNVDCISVERIDEMQALFGQEEFYFDQNNPGGEPIMERKPNGAWKGPQGAQFTRVSGAWIFHSTNCWNFALRPAPTLYFHPLAKLPLPGMLLELSHAKVKQDMMNWTDGKSPRDLLGLPEGWPERELNRPGSRGGSNP